MDNTSATSQNRCRRALEVLLLFASLLSGCSTAHYHVNATLPERPSPVAGYSLGNMKGDNNSDSLVLVLALSGGGYRAAALAHAVMSQLAATPIHWEGQQRSLLDEVDMVSSVSGGSLAAAYFALHPQSFVAEFEQRVLRVDLQASLLKKVLSPPGIWRQTSPTFGRGDLLQEVLDESIFKGKMFSDIPRKRPMVFINATDMRRGRRFEFTQDQFDHLCSDLNVFPVSRAVAASMAVPVILSPITVWNKQSTCPVSPRLRPVAGHAASSSYVHLVDGGLADNTGLNALLENVVVHGGLRRLGQAAHLENVQKRVIIVVNAQVAPQDSEEDSPRTPGLFRQLRSLVNIPIDRHAEAKVQHLAESVRKWQMELSNSDESSGHRMVGDFHVIEINMSRARDSARAKQLQGIPSGLSIEAEQINQIRDFVRDEFAANRQWKDLLDEFSHRDLRANATHDLNQRCELGEQLCEQGTSSQSGVIQ